jgi:adenylate cyclase class 2
MRLPREIEIKLKVENPRSAMRRLRDCGFKVVVPRHFERNVVFDFQNSTLLRRHLLLRLRTERGRHTLTFKAPPHDSKSYKIRPEIESEVEDKEAIERIFQALGLRPVFRYEKYRTTYAEVGWPKRGKKPLVVYDETPIGRFLELEGPTDWIDRTAARLGYRKSDYITASYGALYVNYCREKGTRVGDMVFRRNKS